MFTYKRNNSQNNISAKKRNGHEGSYMSFHAKNLRSVLQKNAGLKQNCKSVVQKMVHLLQFKKNVKIIHFFSVSPFLHYRHGSVPTLLSKMITYHPHSHQNNAKSYLSTKPLILYVILQYELRTKSTLNLTRQ